MHKIKLKTFIKLELDHFGSVIADLISKCDHEV